MLRLRPRRALLAALLLAAPAHAATRIPGVPAAGPSKYDVSLRHEDRPVEREDRARARARLQRRRGRLHVRRPRPRQARPGPPGVGGRPALAGRSRTPRCSSAACAARRRSSRCATTTSGWITDHVDPAALHAARPEVALVREGLGPADPHRRPAQGHPGGEARRPARDPRRALARRVDDRDLRRRGTSTGARATRTSTASCSSTAARSGRSTTPRASRRCASGSSRCATSRSRTSSAWACRGRRACSPGIGGLYAVKDADRSARRSSTTRCCRDVQAALPGRRTARCSATRSTSRPAPKQLGLIHLRAGGLAATGDPRDWESGEVSPIAPRRRVLGRAAGQRRRVVLPAAAVDRRRRRQRARAQRA